MTTIVTLGLDEASQEWFEEQRQRYFPPALNKIPAHVSLFHALPGEGNVGHVLRDVATRMESFPLHVTGVRSMGRGVMYLLEAPESMRLHRELSQQFHAYLTPQDKQPLKPHVVVQNKVEPAEAKELLAVLQASFKARAVKAVGLDWWEYLGGPWRHLERFAFGEERV